MGVPERASVTAKRASGPDRREAGVVGSWNGTDRPRAAVGRHGRHRNAPATISPRSCVRAACVRGYALRQRPLMTRPRRRQAKRVGALWDQAERRWYAPRPGIEDLERWLPFVDLVTSSCWFTNVRPCLGIRLHRHVGRLEISTVPRTCCRRPSRWPGRHDAAGDAAARRAGPARLAGCGGRCRRTRCGGRARSPPQTRKPDSGRPCAKRLLVYPTVG